MCSCSLTSLPSKNDINNGFPFFQPSDMEIEIQLYIITCVCVCCLLYSWNCELTGGKLWFKKLGYPIFRYWYGHRLGKTGSNHRMKTTLCFQTKLCANRILASFWNGCFPSVSVHFQYSNIHYGWPWFWIHDECGKNPLFKPSSFCSFENGWTKMESWNQSNSRFPRVFGVWIQ